MADEVIGTGEAGRPEARSSRREFLVGGALLSSALIAGNASWRRIAGAPPLGRPLAAIVPDRVGAWASSAAKGVLIPTAEVAEETGYEDLLTRYFVDASGRTIMFLIAYGGAQSGSAQLHRPESCYPAAGFSLYDSERVNLAPAGGPEIRGRVMTASKPARIEQILYWSRIGTIFPTDSASQSLATMRQSFRGTAPDGALVRMSILAAERGSALGLLRQFADALLAQPQPAFHRLLTGRS